MGVGEEGLGTKVTTVNPVKHTHSHTWRTTGVSTFILGENSGILQRHSADGI